MPVNIERKSVHYSIPGNKSRLNVESFITILDILDANMSEVDSNVALDYNEYRRRIVAKKWDTGGYKNAHYLDIGYDIDIHYTQQSQKTTSSIYNRISSLRNKIKENASITAEDINELVSIIDYINSKA